MKNDYKSVRISVHVFIHQYGKLLMVHSKKQKHEWELPAGHLMDGESVRSAMVREAKEELNIEINDEDLELALVMHGRNPEYIGLFFNCLKWSGEIQNMEPEKCHDIKFVDYQNLPTNTLHYVQKAIENFQNGVSYSDYQW